MPSINIILPLALLLGAFTASAAPPNLQGVIHGVKVFDPTAALQALQTANESALQALQTANESELASPPPQLAYLEKELRQCFILQGGTPPTVAAGNIANPGTNNVAPAAAIDRFVCARWNWVKET